MTPEQKARQQIDTLLQQCGWLIQDYRAVNLSPGPWIAIREVPMASSKQRKPEHFLAAWLNSRLSMQKAFRISWKPSCPVDCRLCMSRLERIHSSPIIVIPVRARQSILRHAFQGKLVLGQNAEIDAPHQVFDSSQP